MIYGLLGKKLEHSYSPELHRLLGAQDYKLFEVAEEDLESFIKSKEYDGLNVTIPYKKSVIPFLDGMSDIAREAGSVNVIVKKEDGSLYGDNTDVFGFISLVKSSGVFIAGKKALILGSGGAAAAVRVALERLHVSETVIISRSGENNYENISRHFDAEVIVNATPVGMYPDNDSSPVSLEGFGKLAVVFDLIYNPVKTKFILEAEKRGIPAFGGMHMLVMQAAKTEEIFTGSFITRYVSSKAEEHVLKSAKNVTIIGMPGSGKTIVGRRLAYRLGREFVDIDQYIESHENKSIPELFEELGEDGFRELESNYTAEVCKRSGLVISTGGGVISREINRDYLKQNSTVVYLICNNPNASKRKRPILNMISYEDLAKIRIPIYKAWADASILNTGVNETVSSLARILKIPVRRESEEV